MLDLHISQEYPFRAPNLCGIYSVLTRISIYVHRKRALPRKQSVVGLRPAQAAFSTHCRDWCAVCHNSWWSFSLSVCLPQDEELARQLVELGYRGSGEVLKREDFEARKLAAAASKQARGDQQKY